MGDCICVMQVGYIMQVVILKEFYNKLVNLFVVSFIGSLEMNMIDGYIEGMVFKMVG